MKFAIFLQHYFPYGGLQRDAVRLARAALAAGHQPELIVSTWEGERIPDIHIKILAAGGFTNHGKADKFNEACQPLIRSDAYDTSIGFSRVPGSPFHFCGDSCYLEKIADTPSLLSSFLPRYRYISGNEKQIFGAQSPTHVFFLSSREAKIYQSHYPITKDKFTVLPAWLSPPDTSDSREVVRPALLASLGMDESDRLLLFVGSNFKLKRLSHVIEALPLLDDNIHLAVCGQDDTSAPEALARDFGVSDRLHLLGPRDDVASWMKTADLLVHPSLRETAGMVLTEALTHGLPVTCTCLCGYAPHVQAAGGTILSDDCPGEEIAEVVRLMLKQRDVLSGKALEWSKEAIKTNPADLMLAKMEESLTRD